MTYSVIYLTTAQETWQDLTYCFCRSNVPHIFLNPEGHSLSHSDHMIVAACHTKLKELWDELGSIMALFVLVEQTIKDID